MRAVLALVAVAVVVAPSPAVAKSRGAVSVLKTLQAKGMPIDRYVNYSTSSDPNHLLGRPGQYVSKVNFHDRRLKYISDFDTEGGGSIETFNNKTDALRRFKYVTAITRGSPLFAEYDYLSGTVFLRLSNILTPTQASRYKRALLAVT